MFATSIHHVSGFTVCSTVALVEVQAHHVFVSFHGVISFSKTHVGKSTESYEEIAASFLAKIPPHLECIIQQINCCLMSLVFYAPTPTRECRASFAICLELVRSTHFSLQRKQNDKSKELFTLVRSSRIFLFGCCN